MEELYNLYLALKGYSCLDYFSFINDRLSFQYPGIEVKFTIVRYADLFLVKVDGKEVFYHSDPQEIVDFVMI